MWNEKSLQGTLKKLNLSKSLFVNDITTAVYKPLLVLLELWRKSHTCFLSLTSKSTFSPSGIFGGMRLGMMNGLWDKNKETEKMHAPALPALAPPLGPLGGKILHNITDNEYDMSDICFTPSSPATFLQAFCAFCDVCVSRECLLTCLETPGLVRLEAWCSFSNRSLFLDTSSSKTSVLCVTSGERDTSGFCMNPRGQETI
ncbi:hypothetical protein N1851_015601 [Merluccius polli]|uniref:Uncharacterized protein n=1 Tax=Merluccius polli TaxID=89951 RepID=A0AA47MSS9_MERPO|nr:hypothetical protein N1851_015601 [Merluccius polli]